MPRSRSETPASSRRSRSPLSDHDSDHERTNEYRVHIAELTPGVQEHDIRKAFQRFGTLVDVWVASASCFAFVVYKYKEDAQKAIDQMDGRSFGNNRLKVTWARPRTRNRSHRHDPNMRCFKCGERGHFSRECDNPIPNGRSSRRREHDFGRYPSNNGRYSRSRSPYSPVPLPPPLPAGYFRHGIPQCILLHLHADMIRISMDMSYRWKETIVMKIVIEIVEHVLLHLRLLQNTIDDKSLQNRQIEELIRDICCY